MPGASIDAWPSTNTEPPAHICENVSKLLERNSNVYGIRAYLIQNSLKWQQLLGQLSNYMHEPKPLPVSCAHAVSLRQMSVDLHCITPLGKEADAGITCCASQCRAQLGHTMTLATSQYCSNLNYEWHDLLQACS